MASSQNGKGGADPQWDAPHRFRLPPSTRRDRLRATWITSSRSSWGYGLGRCTSFQQHLSAPQIRYHLYVQQSRVRPRTIEGAVETEARLEDRPDRQHRDQRSRVGTEHSARPLPVRLRHRPDHAARGGIRCAPLHAQAPTPPAPNRRSRASVRVNATEPALATLRTGSVASAQGSDNACSFIVFAPTYTKPLTTTAGDTTGAPKSRDQFIEPVAASKA